MQQSSMKRKADTARAEADAAYDIQKEAQRKTIEVASADADIARREKEAELAEKEILLQEKRLDAEIRKKADAMKYEAEQQAEAELIRRQRDADASAYEAIKVAEARKAEADALKYAMEQEAEGIRAKGLAEAEAIEKKALAQQKMTEASVLEMLLAVLPEMAKNIAAPLASVDSITMYGSDNTTKLMQEVTNSSSQIFEAVKTATGLDITELIAGFATKKAAPVETPVDADAIEVPLPEGE